MSKLNQILDILMKEMNMERGGEVGMAAKLTKAALRIDKEIIKDVRLSCLKDVLVEYNKCRFIVEFKNWIYKELDKILKIKN